MQGDLEVVLESLPAHIDFDIRDTVRILFVVDVKFRTVQSALTVALLSLPPTGQCR